MRNSILFSRFTGWHMFAVMALFFGTIISVNIFMARSAVMSWTGLVVKNSYVASQEFNTKLHDAKAQTELGYNHGLSYADGVVQFDLRANDGSPVDLSSPKVDLGRPTNVGQDASAALSRAPDGAYFATLPLADGEWIATMTGELEDFGPWKMEYRISIDKQKSAAQK